MNKHDWVFVGMRLLGLYFFVQALLGLPFNLWMALEGAHPQLAINLVSSGLTMLVGLVLFLGAPMIQRWQSKDARLESDPVVGLDDQPA